MHCSQKQNTEILPPPVLVLVAVDMAGFALESTADVVVAAETVIGSEVSMAVETVVFAVKATYERWTRASNTFK